MNDSNALKSLKRRIPRPVKILIKSLIDILLKRPKKIIVRSIKALIVILIDPEILIDIREFRKNRDREVVRRFPPWKAIRIDLSRDVNLVFFCGLGDALYGIPLFLELRKKCDRAGVKLNAWCSTTAGTFANGAVASLLADLKLFDSVSSFHGKNGAYWKCFSWDELLAEHRDEKFYPFLYPTRRSLRTRSEAILRQFALRSKRTLASFDLPDTEQSRRLTQLIECRMQDIGAKNVVFCHFDARSGNYKYPHADYILRDLVKRNYMVVTATSPNSGALFCEPSILILRPGEFPLLSVARALADVKAKIIAINSVFWPVSEMIQADTLALHYLRSNDGHHFYHDKMMFVSPQKYSVQRVARGIHAKQDMFLSNSVEQHKIDYRRDVLVKLTEEFLKATRYEERRISGDVSGKSSSAEQEHGNIASEVQH